MGSNVHLRMGSHAHRCVLVFIEFELIDKVECPIVDNMI